MITFTQILLNEIAFGGAGVGFAEMVAFYQKATDKEIRQLEVSIKKNDLATYKKLMQKVLKITL